MTPLKPLFNFFKWGIRIVYSRHYVSDFYGKRIVGKQIKAFFQFRPEIFFYSLEYDGKHLVFKFLFFVFLIEPYRKNAESIIADF